MVQLSYKGPDHTKADQIIEAAQRRFGLYGFDKTSMKEIASDLSMSKGSLYYYFPDKEHLYKAIVYKEHEQFIKSIMSETSHSADPVLMLRKMMLTRQELFRTLINLGRLRSTSLPLIRTFMKDTIAELRMQEREIIRDILSAGVKVGVFLVPDIDETASLLLDLLRGLRITMVKEMTEFNLAVEDYEILIKKTALFMDIFIKGITPVAAKKII